MTVASETVSYVQKNYTSTVKGFLNCWTWYKLKFSFQFVIKTPIYGSMNETLVIALIKIHLKIPSNRVTKI